MRKISFILALLVLTIGLAACGADSKNEGEGKENNGGNSEQAETMTLKHELDETTFDKNPKKVVVFDFGVLDTMDKLGIEVIGLPKTSIPNYLSKYEDDKYENVGSLKEPDFEKIHALDPDLIIISGRQSSLYDQFKEIAPTIYMGLDTTKYMESFKYNVETIGEIFGKEDQAKTELTAIDDKIKSLSDEVSQLDGKALVMLANEGNMSAYGSNSRFGIIHDVFGFKQADENIEATTHGQSITSEYILEKNPDYLFVIDRSAAIGGEVKANETIENDLVKKTNAYKNGKIIYLDPESWYLSGGGLESVAIMVDEIEGALNK
ncbi:siderophore ABC transporter substrate-binding protein [Bacillus niameyensis]|uniref:siderophore ABC transporter substrate-binding protein n=1 Tax=Bacillus niameyensis TaxID=1522308 RepID=UPI00078494B7|nr:siderophore ABC transporter substrate-binding protein [Bacillus niameyensis]